MYYNEYPRFTSRNTGEERPSSHAIVTGSGRVVGNGISEHPDVDLVAITGSVGSGRKVTATAASTVKRVHLELGGKAPVVVFDDADLGAAAKGVRSAGFWNGGQECGSACRVLVHESVAEKFTELLVREVSEISVGAPGAGDDVEIGSMISGPTTTGCWPHWTTSARTA